MLVRRDNQKILFVPVTVEKLADQGQVAFERFKVPGLFPGLFGRREPVAIRIAGARVDIGQPPVVAQPVAQLLDQVAAPRS